MSPRNKHIHYKTMQNPAFPGGLSNIMGRNYYTSETKYHTFGSQSFKPRLGLELV